MRFPISRCQGESHAWPDYACAFGQFDIAGSPKPHAYWYVVNWLQLIAATDAGRPQVPKRDVARVLDLADQVRLCRGCAVAVLLLLLLLWLCWGCAVTVL